MLISEVNDIPRIIKVRDNKIVADTIFQLDDAGIINMQKFLIQFRKRTTEDFGKREIKIT